MDNIVFTCIWKDQDLIQMEVEFITNRIIIREKIYTSLELLFELREKIDFFLCKNIDEICWKNCINGFNIPPSIILKFIKKDNVGHILIEAYVEIDDGYPTQHNASFSLETEIGLMYQFKEGIGMDIRQGTVLCLGDKETVFLSPHKEDS